MTPVAAGATKNPRLGGVLLYGRTAKVSGKRTLPRCACRLSGARGRTDAIPYHPAQIPPLTRRRRMVGGALGRGGMVR